MAYAPHSNDLVSADNDLPLILGQFDEASHGTRFEFAQRRDAQRDTLWPEFPHIIFVGYSGKRYAKVGKTVAHIVIDEAADGSPVVEKWSIRNRRDYDTSWVKL